MRRLLIIFALLFAPATYGQTCKTVSVAGSGAATGADWSNTLAASSLNLSGAVRNTVYYMLGGTYAAKAANNLIGWQFSTAASGTQTITFRAATAADQGTAAGCGQTGWSSVSVNAASPSNPVIWQCGPSCTWNTQTSYEIEVETPYYVFDGNGTGNAPCGSYTTNNCNMRVANAYPNNLAYSVYMDSGAYPTGGHYTTIQYVDLPGAGLDLENTSGPAPLTSATCNSGGTAATIVYALQSIAANHRSTAYAYTGQWIVVAGVGSGMDTPAGGSQVTVVNQMSSPQSLTYAASCTPNTVVNSTGTITGPLAIESQVVYNQGMGTAGSGATHVTLFGNYIHDYGQECVNTGESDNWTMKYNACQRGSGNSNGFHSSAASDSGSANQVWAYNIITDYSTFTGLTVLHRVVNETASNWQVYGNIFGMTNNNYYARAPNGSGPVSCVNTGTTCSGWVIANNTITYQTAGSASNFAGDGSATMINNVCENNLWWSNGGGQPSQSMCTTLAYNSYLNTTAPSSLGTGEVSDQTASTPFVSPTTSNFQLNNVTPVDVNSRTSLSSPYDVDYLGVTYFSGTNGTRGAYQFNGTPQASTPTFSPAAGTYTGTQSVTLSSTGGVICYNTTGAPATNGTSGCTTGTLYTGAITVSSSETLYAVGGGTGYTDSAVGSAAYTINAPAGNPSSIVGTVTILGTTVVH